VEASDSAKRKWGTIRRTLITGKYFISWRKSHARTWITSEGAEQNARRNSRHQSGLRCHSRQNDSFCRYFKSPFPVCRGFLAEGRELCLALGRLALDRRAHACHDCVLTYRRKQGFSASLNFYSLSISASSSGSSTALRSQVSS
jgi:hypothetical protein